MVLVQHPLRMHMRLTPQSYYQPRPQFPNQGYLPNGNVTGPTPNAQSSLPTNGRVIQSGSTRVLCVADVRGMLWMNIF